LCALEIGTYPRWPSRFSIAPVAPRGDHVRIQGYEVPFTLEDFVASAKSPLIPTAAVAGPTGRPRRAVAQRRY
jgi:hypothetical protein